VALAALLVPAAARAQSADAGPGEAGQASAEEGAGGEGDDLPPMMRDPRQLSGVARGEQNDPAGQLTVRAVQGALQRSEFGDIRGQFPRAAPIHLVGIGVGGKLTHSVVQLDNGGRVVFPGLATNFSQSYFVLALFPRAGAEDRLSSKLISMPPQVGLRMMLAGEGVDSGKPPVDDTVGDEGKASESAEPGVVVVQLRGDTKDILEVELLEPGVDKPVARTKVEVVTRDGEVQGRVSPPEDDAALRAGVLEVLVARRGQGVADVAVEIGVADAPAGTAAVATARTDQGGRALFEPLPRGKQYVVRAPVKGQPFTSSAFAWPEKAGQRVKVDVDWQAARGLEARFTGVASGPDKVYVARAADRPRPFLTQPFQLTSTRGVVANLVVAPPVLLAFHGGANIEDEKLYFQVQFSIYSASMVPFEAGREGLRIPLPRNFAGASVDEENSARVKIDEEGLIWRGLLPPGERTFIVNFALNSEDGKAELDWRFPYPLYPSQVVFEKVAGFNVQGPPDIKPQSAKTDDGRPLLVLQGIQRDVGEPIKMSFTGLPMAAQWQKLVARLAGVLVFALVGWAIWGIAFRNRRGGGRLSHLEAEREELLHAVVQLESDLRRARVSEADYKQRRAELQRQLETTYSQLAVEERAAEARAARAPG
jgi:hypothetical protein